MKFNRKITTSVTAVALIGLVGLTGCTSNSTSASATASTGSSSSSSSTAAQTGDSTISYDTHYDSDDLTWDDSSVTTIDLSNPTASDGVTVEDNTITVTADGNYRLTGTLDDGQIVVNAGDNDTVRLILDNASITNSDGSAIDIENADEAIIYTASGSTNSVSDGSSYAGTTEEDPDAAIFSRADLTLAGEGTLKVTGHYNDGVATRDGLVIASGTLEVTAQNHAIKGKDYVDIIDGTVTATATEGDGIKSTNTTDEERGWVRLSGGTVTIAAADDGFKAEKELEISGGSLTITQSNEGIEAQYITVSGGKTEVTSTDDGINATVPDTDETAEESSTNTAVSGGVADTPPNMSGNAPADIGGQAPADMGGGMEQVEDASVTITGGSLTVTAEGDGFDSNGTASMSGGVLTLNGPSNGGNGVFDTAGEFTVTGGTIVAGGTSDMFVAPSSDQQGYLATTDLSSTSTGDTVTVVDSGGNTLATYTVTDKGTQLFFVTAEGIVAGESYTVEVNGSQVTTVTAS